MATDKITAEDSEIASTDLSPRSFGEVWKDWFIATLKYFWKKIHSPFGIYIISTWLVSVLIMGITNTLQGGSFWAGPSYWMEVFLTYGLNTGQDAGLRIIAKPIFVWFFAPVIALILGFTLFLLADSGYFRNGGLPAAVEADFNEAGRFFSMDNIWGQELLNPDKPKFTKTYIWIVIMPIILGAAISGLYNFIMFKMIKKRKYLPSTKSFLLIVFICALIIGIEMALMTGELVLEFKRLFYSLFVDRRDNQFLIYGLEHEGQGQYHPIAIALTTWLIYLVPFFMIYFILLILGNLDNVWKNRTILYDKVVGFVEARREPELEKVFSEDA